MINLLHQYSGDPADYDDLVGADVSEVTMEDANRILNSNKDEIRGASTISILTRPT
jgi:hypothetical protein